MGPLSDKRVVELISKNFVPLALDLYKIRDDKGPAGDFWRSLYKQTEHYQGLWLLDNSGKVLAAHHDQKTKAPWADEVLRDLSRGKAAFGKIEPRQPQPTDPMPYRGRGIRADGSRTFAIYVRQLGEGKPVGDAVLDRVTFSAKAFSAFVGSDLSKGSTWKVPKSVAGVFVRCLAPNSDLTWVAKIDEITEFDLRGSVHESTEEKLTLTYSGRIAMKHTHLYDKAKFNRGRATIQGTAQLDPTTKAVRSITFVFDGTYHEFQPYDKDAVSTFAAAQWRKSSGQSK